jgi:hypothetical protein
VKGKGAPKKSAEASSKASTPTKDGDNAGNATASGEEPKVCARARHAGLLRAAFKLQPVLPAVLASDRGRYAPARRGVGRVATT